MLREFDKDGVPFLRWIGGKQRLTTELIASLPGDVASATYHEPFLGAGAVFAALHPARSFVSDANIHLIAMYEAVRNEPRKVFVALRRFAIHHTEVDYYRIREQYNNNKSTILRAARFIYLNRTSYNGIFRVNERGKYNVPYGHLERVIIPSLETLSHWSRDLQNAQLAARPFEKMIDDVKSGDVVYLDPPYPPTNDTAYFTHYTWDRFDAAKQRATADLAMMLDRYGCRVMISNADTTGIRQLYKGWRIKKTRVARVVTAKGVVYRARELILTNY